MNQKIYILVRQFQDHPGVLYYYCSKNGWAERLAEARLYTKSKAYRLAEGRSGVSVMTRDEAVVAFTLCL